MSRTSQYSWSNSISVDRVYDIPVIGGPLDGYVYALRRPPAKWCETVPLLQFFGDFMTLAKQPRNVAVRSPYSYGLMQTASGWRYLAEDIKVVGRLREELPAVYIVAAIDREDSASVDPSLCHRTVVAIAADPQCISLAFDMKNVRYHVVGLLKLLLASHKARKGHARDIEVINCNVALREVFRVTRLDTLFVVR
jgi:hypothetical protein